MIPYSLEWWWQMHDCAQCERYTTPTDELRYAYLAEWIQKRIERRTVALFTQFISDSYSINIPDRIIKEWGML
jgi:hypothetical protein